MILKKKKKRVGRGGSRGGTSCRGHKGQRARSGGKSGIRASFEGGQMPLSRRLPRRGFTNVFKKNFVLVSLHDLDIHFSDNDIVDRNSLIEKGLISRRDKALVKVLSNGDLNKKLTVNADAFSKSAIDNIVKGGGKAQISEGIKSSGDSKEL